ncbi:23699_t:CDS:2, partial [Cetraspora pellucida]
GLIILKQLLIFPDYLCINLIQITKKKYTYYKLKGHIITLPQNSESEIPEVLLLTTTVVDIDFEEAEHYTELDNKINEESDYNNHNLNKFINNNLIYNANNFRTSRILHVNNIPITKKELTLYFLQNNINNDLSSNSFIDFTNNNLQTATSTITISNKTIDPLEKFESELNKEQKKAYFLVCDHYQRNQPILESRPSQLLFYLADTGETDKSRVIQAMSYYFTYTSQCQTLLILASTGIAAVNVYKSTIHSAYGFSFGENSKKPAILTEETLCKLQELWSKVEYVILKEVSIIGQNLLAQFHAFIKKLK